MESRKAVNALLDIDQLKEAVTNLFDNDRIPCEEERIAACSALNYAAVRLEQEHKNKEAEELRMTLESYGLIPQSVYTGYMMNADEIKLSPAGDICVSSGNLRQGYKVFEIIASRSMKPLMKLPTKDASFLSDISIAPDSIHAAVHTHDSLMIWDMSRLRVILNVGREYGPIMGVAWSPDSTKLAFASIHSFKVVDLTEESPVVREIKFRMRYDAGCICIDNSAEHMMFIRNDRAFFCDLNTEAMTELASGVKFIGSVPDGSGFVMLTENRVIRVSSDGEISSDSDSGIDMRFSNRYSHRLIFKKPMPFIQNSHGISVGVPDRSGGYTIHISEDLEVTKTPGYDEYKSIDRLPDSYASLLKKNYPYTDVKESNSRICKRTSYGLLCVEADTVFPDCAVINVFRVVSDAPVRNEGRFLNDNCSEQYFRMRSKKLIKEADDVPDIPLPGYAEDCSYIRYRLYDDVNVKDCDCFAYDVMDADSLLSMKWHLYNGAYYASNDECVFRFDGKLSVRELPANFYGCYVCKDGIFAVDKEGVYTYDFDSEESVLIIPHRQYMSDKNKLRCLKKNGESYIFTLNDLESLVFYYDKRMDRTEMLSRNGKSEAIAFMDGKAVYIDEDEIVIADPDSAFSIIKTIRLDGSGEWLFKGMSSDGTLSFINAQRRKATSKHDSYDVTFGMMRLPEYRFELFEGVKAEDVHVSRFGSDVDMRKNDFVLLGEEVFTKSTLMYCRIGSGKLSNQRIIHPDMRRLRSKVHPVEGGKYLVCSNEAEDDDNCRMVLRLMDPMTGRPIGYGLKGSQGQMFGEPGSVFSSDSNSAILGGRYLVAESKSNRAAHRNLINSWDISSGKRYPEEGYVTGKILGFGDDTVTIGLVDHNIVHATAVMDSRLNILSRTELNVDLHVRNRPPCRKLSIKGVKHADKEPTVGYVPANCMFYGSIRSPDTPVIIPLGEPVHAEEPAYPQPFRFGLGSKVPEWVSMKCMFCMLSEGMVTEPEESEIILALDPEDDGEAAVEAAITNGVFLYRRDGRYVFGQVQRNRGELFDPQYLAAFGTSGASVLCNHKHRDSVTSPLDVRDGCTSWLEYDRDVLHHRSDSGDDIILPEREYAGTPEPMLLKNGISVIRDDKVAYIQKGSQTDTFPMFGSTAADLEVTSDKDSHILFTENTGTGRDPYRNRSDRSRKEMFVLDLGDSRINSISGLFYAEKKGF